MTLIMHDAVSLLFACECIGIHRNLFQSLNGCGDVILVGICGRLKLHPEVDFAEG